MVVSIKITPQGSSKLIGVAFADASLRELGVSEFIDNDLFSNTEVRSFFKKASSETDYSQSLLIQLGIKEAIVPENPKENDLDLLKLKSVLERIDVLITERKRTDWNTRNIEQDLGNLLANVADSGTLRELLSTRCKALLTTVQPSYHRNRQWHLSLP
jgi:DNA mismatch repair protein MSH2